MTMREISIDFRKGTVTTIDTRNGIPFTTVLLGTPDMDELIEETMIETHFNILYRDKTPEELMEYIRDEPCDHPDCHMHPYTWGKTQEELDKTYEKDFNEYHNMDKLNDTIQRTTIR